MIRILGLAWAFGLFLIGQFAVADTVLVYSGPGACKEGCAQAAAEIPATLGYKIQYVSAQNLTQELLDQAVAWVQPGGNAIKAAKSLKTDRLKMISDFIARGGAYIGFCAGAFLADKYVDDDHTIKGLNVLPIETFDYPLDSNNRNGVMVWVYWGGVRRHMFFNGGASFHLEKKKPVQVLATYGLDGLPAATQNEFGKGRVVVSGFHPEATEVWKSGTGEQDQDGTDYDLGQEMVLRALRRL